jgi:hypothetical protein
MTACERDECICCGRGHWCEPDRYPEALGDQWTCPECGRLHHAYDPHNDNLPDWVTAKIPADVLGWRSTGSAPRGIVNLEEP